MNLVIIFDRVFYYLLFILSVMNHNIKFIIYEHCN